MYLNEIITDRERMERPSFNVRFEPSLVRQADRVEVHSSSFSDGGEDYNLFRLMAANRVLCAVRQNGY